MRLINPTTHFEDDVLNSTQLWLARPVSPSTWVGSPEYMKVTRLLMTCGGGLGGAQWKEYVMRVDSIRSNEIQGFETFDGRRVLLNSSFIVKADDYTLVKVLLDNQNYNYPNGVHTYYYLVEDGARVELRK